VGCVCLVVGFVLFLVLDICWFGCGCFLFGALARLDFLIFGLSKFGGFVV